MKMRLLTAIVLLASTLSCSRRQLAPDELELNRIFGEILHREDRRTLGDDDFLRRNLNSSPFPEARRWSAMALGRIGDAKALPWLYDAAASPFADVRAAAAFAVGEIEDRAALAQEFREGDPAAVKTLSGLMADPALQVKVRAIEALGKIAPPTEASNLVRRLESLRYDGSNESRTLLSFAITALMRLRAQPGVPLLEQWASLPDRELQWRVANALYRMRAKEARPTLVRLVKSSDPDVQAHAARALGICEDPALADLLIPLLKPNRETGPQALQVRVLAVQALGNLKNPAAIPAIGAALDADPIAANPDQTNFAVQAAAALGQLGAPAGADILARLAGIDGPVANSAVVALARVMKGADPNRFFALIDPGRFTSPAALRALAQAYGELGGERAVHELKGILIRAPQGEPGGAETLAVATVVTALARAEAPDLPEILPAFLASRDGVVLRAAAAAYKPATSDKTPWEPLTRAYREMAAGSDLEAKTAVLDALEPWAREAPVQATLRAALKDWQRNVRIAALRLLRKSGASDIPSDAGPAESSMTQATHRIIAGSRQNRTVAVLDTSRGRIEIELFREDAPLTVANFVSLARRGFFDGLTFMRVVPYFVIQGGDPRNDMEGGPGHTIRCEINLRPYERGSLGMALAGKDTGGSQFFITHSPQPHLDGGYTCFGRVISGMTAVDRMVAGDVIRKAWIVEDVAALDYRRR